MDNRDQIYSLFKEKEPLLWIGSGVSLALCAFASTVCQKNSISSLYSAPEDDLFFEKRNYIVVSASNRDLVSSPSLKIIDSKLCKKFMNETNIVSLQCPGQEDPWLSSDFAFCFLDWVASIFSIKNTIPKIFTEKITPNPSVCHLILVPQYSLIFEKLIKASNNKLLHLNFELVSISEFGHGIHYRVWAEPQKYRIIILSGLSLNNSRNSLVKSWFLENSIIFWEHQSKYQINSSDFLIECFSIILKYIKIRSKKQGINPEKKPMPNNIDILR